MSGRATLLYAADAGRQAARSVVDEAAQGLADIKRGRPAHGLAFDRATLQAERGLTHCVSPPKMLLRALPLTSLKSRPSLFVTTP